jgi:ketosteroid isomerase-like protein
MKEQSGNGHNEHIVTTYFEQVRELRAGKEAAVERLTEMWDPDGVFEFAGAPPVNGIFKGRMAIQTLYQNRVKAAGMPIRLEDSSTHKEIALGAVDTDVHKVRTVDEKLVAGWTTKIGTKDGRGFQVSGSPTFTFKNGRISTLKVVISPKADKNADLKLENLTVTDIGRLALAAWPVV